MDFSKLGSAKKAQAPTDPIRIFDNAPATVRMCWFRLTPARFQTSAQPSPPVDLVAPRSKQYQIPFGSASAGVGSYKAAYIYEVFARTLAFAKFGRSPFPDELIRRDAQCSVPWRPALRSLRPTGRSAVTQRLASYQSLRLQGLIPRLCALAHLAAGLARGQRSLQSGTLLRMLFPILAFEAFDVHHFPANCRKLGGIGKPDQIEVWRAIVHR